MRILENLGERVQHLKRETFALYLAARHPETPWYAKIFVAGLVAYALSPIDLIPDFVPILGYADDLVLIPLGIAFALWMIPSHVIAECRAAARGSPVSGGAGGRIVAVVVVAIWLVVAAVSLTWAYEMLATSAVTTERS